MSSPGARTDVRRADALAPKGRRSVIALVVSVAVGMPVFVLLARSYRDRDALALGTVAFMLIMAIACLTYVLVTVRAFPGVPAAALPELVRARPVATWRVLLRGGSDGPAFAIQYACLALAAAVVLPRLDVLFTNGTTRTLVVVLAVVGVGCCWALLVVSYAVHYARVHSRSGGLRFPGPEEPTFGDYVYFSVAVGTTPGTTDVQVDRRGMRRVVTGHALLSFAFNTVIVALVVSALTA